MSTCNRIPLVQVEFNPTRIEKLTTLSGILSGPGRGQGKNCFGRSWLDFQYNIVSERILTLRVIDFEGLVYKGMIYWLVDLAGQAGKVGFCGVVATINCVVTQEIWRITRTLLCSAPALLFCKYFSPFCVAIAPILQLRSFQNLSVSEGLDTFDQISTFLFYI